MQNGSKFIPKCIQKANEKTSEFRIEQITKKAPHQGVQGGSNEPAFHSQNCSWDPLGTPNGSRASRQGPLDDFWPNVVQIVRVFGSFCIDFLGVFESSLNDFCDCVLWKQLRNLCIEKKWSNEPAVQPLGGVPSRRKARWRELPKAFG